MNLVRPSLSRLRPRALVIGGGIAGLACTLRLQASGFQVSLIERHDYLGGKIRTVPSAAGPVDAGPTVLTMRHVFDDLFTAAGERLDAHVHLIKQEVLARHFWPDGACLDLCANPERNVAAVRAFAGAAAADEFRAFNARTATLFEAFDAPMMQAAEPRIAQLASLVLSRPSLLGAMAPLSTLAQSLASDFSDPRLAQLFGRYATYVGGGPQFSPALLSLIWQAEAAGVWVVEGGMHKLALAIQRLCERLGARIFLKSHVAAITTRDGAVTGAELDSGVHAKADTIVFAGDPRALATGALGPNVAGVATQTRTQPRSYSARVMSFAAKTDGAALAHHNVFFDADPVAEFNDLAAGRIPRTPTVYLCAEDRGRATPAPTLERFELIANAPALGPDGPMSDERELSSWHQQIIRKMTDFNVTFSPPPEMSHITTPRDFERMFPASQGALYGQSPHGMTASLKRPRARTKIKGLYLCGGGTHPGAGVPMATISARHAAEAILSDRTSASPCAPMATPGGMSTG